MVSLTWYHISDIKKTDMVTKLICQLPDVDAFGKYCFETLPKVRGSVNEVSISGETAEVCEIQITYDNPENSEFSVELPLEDSTFASLQGNDPKIRGSSPQSGRKRIQSVLLYQK